MKSQLFSFWSRHRHLKLSVPEVELPFVPSAFLLLPPVNSITIYLGAQARHTGVRHDSSLYDPPPTVNTSLEFISKVFSSLCLCCCHPIGDTIMSYLVTALVFQLRSLPSTRLHAFIHSCIHVSTPPVPLSLPHRVRTGRVPPSSSSRPSPNWTFAISASLP